MPTLETAITKTITMEPSVDFEPTVLPIQGAKDSVNTSAYIERGPYLPRSIEGMKGIRMIGNPPVHVAGFTRMPTCSGDHWYIARG